MITLREHRRGSIVLALFGFSGWATEAVGDQLVLREDLFWPPAVKLKSREVGVFVCQLTRDASEGGDVDQSRMQPASCAVIPLGAKIIEDLLR